MQDIVKNVVDIMRSNFPNGIRDDFIDTSKVSRIYSVNNDGEQISRNYIVEIIRANGIEDGGRFYFISDENAESIRHFLDEILSANSIAYYTKIHEKHSDFFVATHVFSPDVLKKILQTAVGGHFYFSEFCSAKRAVRLDYLIAQIFTAAKTSLSIDDLQEKLPYVPSEKILEVLSDAKKYLPTSAGKFIPFSKIQFDTDEIDAAKKQISLYIDKVGYAIPEDYSLSSNFALNPEVAEKDMRNIIYEKFFSENFTKRGKRLFKRGIAGRKSVTGASNRFREFIGEQTEDKKTKTGSIKDFQEFISEQEKLTLEKLSEVAENFGVVRYVALYSAYEQMVRVDKDLFVKDALINFDVVEVDKALRPFVKRKIIPLRGVTSFTGFPPVEGYSWNLFLLESFLRKYSKKYVYAAPAANSVNAGAIYPKSMEFADYLDVQALAVVQERVPLEKSAIEDFLVDKGFRARCIDKVTERIIARAQEMIDERH